MKGVFMLGLIVVLLFVGAEGVALLHHVKDEAPPAQVMTPQQECEFQGGQYTQGQIGGTCTFNPAQSWDQGTLKQGDSEQACIARHGIPIYYVTPEHRFFVECK